MSDKTFDHLIELMLMQAKSFLEEIGEFFPYGSVLTSGRELKTIGVYNDDDDDFNAQKAIKILEDSISESFHLGEILLGAIGIDVFVDKKDALMIKLTHDGNTWQERYYPYKLINERIIFSDSEIEK